MFENELIGKKDSTGIELRNGDNISIEVSKPIGSNLGGVYHVGEIIFNNCAFSLKWKRYDDVFNITPLCNYAPYCKITKQ